MHGFARRLFSIALLFSVSLPASAISIDIDIEINMGASRDEALCAAVHKESGTIRGLE